MNLDYSLFVSEKREMRKNRENYTRMQERNGQKGERERERERNCIAIYLILWDTVLSSACHIYII